MNFLAHLHLAGDDPKAQVGQVLADFVRARDIERFEPAIQAGIRAHQRIDVYTDTHPVVAKARRRVQKSYRRYAGILLDVFFDHYLAVHWKTYSPHESLAEFTRRSYRNLHEHRHIYPGRFPRVVSFMRRDDWLGSYRDLAQVDRALKGISSRFKRQNPVGDGIEVLETHYQAFSKDFAEFFPEVTAFVRDSTVAKKP